ncbi:hypothetical protein CPB97_007490 [Podila verticillata]|nr:hypothetical protein CPB97_007490 [Podila verticillata]
MGYLALCSDLILKSPELSAISIEGIQYSQPAVTAIDQFLDILEKHPQITGVYLRTLGHDSIYEDVLRGTWSRMLARITASNIRSLHIYDTIPRSERGPSRAPWPTRESPIWLKVADSNLYRESPYPRGGRWEAEKRYPVSYVHSIAVMERSGVLDLALPHFMTLDDWTSMLRRFPGLKHLRTDTLALRGESRP